MTYSTRLKVFTRYNEVANSDKLLRWSRKKIHDSIASFVKSQRAKGNSAKSCGLYLAALKHFYTVNDNTDINWTMLKKYCGEHIRAVNDRPYNITELRTMLRKADIRKRVLILLMASSGIRVGAIPDLKIKHVRKLDKLVLYRLLIYERTLQEYITYTTPEFAAAFDEYLDERRRFGGSSTQRRRLFASSSRQTTPTPTSRSRFPRLRSTRSYVNSC